MSLMSRSGSGPAGPNPPWAEAIRQKYLRGESGLFLLHDNIFDRVLVDDDLVDLPDFLSQSLLWKNKRNIIVYDPSSRVHVLKKEDGDLASLFAEKRGPSEILSTIEELLLTATSTAVLIRYVDMIAPNGEMHFLSDQDRKSVITLHRWSLDERISARDNVVFLFAEQLSSVHPMLVSNPRVATVQIPLPSRDERAAIVRFADPSLDDSYVAKFAAHTAGLKAIHVRSIISQSTHEVKTHPQESALELVQAHKREMIEKECFGLIEFVSGRHDFSAVGGMAEVKEELRRIAHAVRAGDRARVPMGLLLVGAMGTGKTFLATAFANECGITAIKLKNFRSKWVGSTESNLEKVLGIVKALGPILVIVDEGERSFGDGGDSDGGTSSRVIARIKEFMSDPENRGQVIFILMTNRPDKLDADIKRAGRLDRKIPLFYAGNEEEVEAIIQAQLRRYSIRHSIDFPRDRDKAQIKKIVGYSNAELEAVTLLANDLAHTAGAEVTASLFAQACSDYLPTRDESMLRLMELLAVFEASNRKMLPPKYRNLSNDELNAALVEARMAVSSSRRI